MGEKGNVVGLGGVKEPRKFNLVTALAKMINLYVWPHIYVAQQTSEMGGARRRLLCAQLNPCMQVLRSLEAQVKCTYRCS